MELGRLESAGVGCFLVFSCQGGDDQQPGRFQLDASHYDSSRPVWIALGFNRGIPFTLHPWHPKAPTEVAYTLQLCRHICPSPLQSSFKEASRPSPTGDSGGRARRLSLIPAGHGVHEIRGPLRVLKKEIPYSNWRIRCISRTMPYYAVFIPKERPAFCGKFGISF